MKNAASEARERDLREGRKLEPEEGQEPIVRFYTEPVVEMEETGMPGIEVMRDEVPRRSRRGRRDDSVDEVEMKRTPTPSQGTNPTAWTLIM
jgi:hypothetical protein